MIQETKTRKFRLPLLCITLLIVSATPDAWAQQAIGSTKQEIVGTWKLVKDIHKGSDGIEDSVFGAIPSGQIIFTNGGRYSSMNARADIPKFATANRMLGTTEEYKAVAQGSIASFRAYSVSNDGKFLFMTPESSTYPNWNGVEQKRALAVSGDELIYSVNASVGGTSKLTYRRVK
jgi:hypothetical protein